MKRRNNNSVIISLLLCSAHTPLQTAEHRFVEEGPAKPTVAGERESQAAKEAAEIAAREAAEQHRINQNHNIIAITKPTTRLHTITPPPSPDGTQLQLPEIVEPETDDLTPKGREHIRNHQFSQRPTSPEEKRAEIITKSQRLSKNITLLKTQVTNALEAKHFVTSSDLPDAHDADLYQEFESKADQLNRYLDQENYHNNNNSDYPLETIEKNFGKSEDFFKKLKKSQEELLQKIRSAKPTKESTANYKAVENFKLTKVQKETKTAITDYDKWLKSLDSKTLSKVNFDPKDTPIINHLYRKLEGLKNENIKTKEEKVTVLEELKLLKETINNQRETYSVKKIKKSWFGASK